MNLQTATYKILYNNQNITKDVGYHLKQLGYTDKVGNEADEIQITLEDADGLWQNDWYPEKLAKLTVQLIQEDGRVLECGEFTIDEPEFSFSKSGDEVTIKGVSAFFTQQLRTKRSTAHENKTLAEVARTVASRHKLQVIGSIPSITIGRVTQKQQSDLGFLQRLAVQYGLVFSVRSGKMIFTDVFELEKSGSVLTLDKTDIISGTITDKSADTYKKANVVSHNPDTKKKIEYADDGSEEDDNDNESVDTLEVRTKAENESQAERMAKAALHWANSKQQEGSITVPGNVLLVSGVNFELTGCGKLSGIYNITESQHSLDATGGYSTSLTIKRVQKIDASKFKPKHK
jgi:uncharacterized protein